MIDKQLVIAQIKDITEAKIIKEIYLSSFQKDERRPWQSIIDLSFKCSHPLFQLAGIYFEGRLIGMITTWNFEDFVYIEHFAIDISHRNKGIGCFVLNILRNRIGNKPLILEAEPSETSVEASRRIKFYQRNGFEVIDSSYIQPPYSKNGNSVNLWLLSTTAISPVFVTNTLYKYVYCTDKLL